MRSSWGHLGVILGSSWGRLGVVLGSSCCPVDSNRASSRAGVSEQPGNKKVPGQFAICVNRAAGQDWLSDDIRHQVARQDRLSDEILPWSQITGSSLTGQFFVTGQWQHYRLRTQRGRRESSGAHRAIASNREVVQGAVPGSRVS